LRILSAAGIRDVILPGEKDFAERVVNLLSLARESTHS